MFKIFRAAYVAFFFNIFAEVFTGKQRLIDVKGQD